ncbi:suppressor of zeste 12 [Chamberlinius hualienensis]
MPPKRRFERENENIKLPSLDQIQTDHELFLQAFEKPTQIYRFLRTRSFILPCFLPRNLTYMNHRMSRKHSKRKDFKVDGILDKVTAIRKQELDPHCSYNYLNIIFNGLYDKVHKGFLVAPNSDNVMVETSLIKLCHKKRKDVSSPLLEVILGQNRVPRNPDQRNQPLNASSSSSSISVPTSNFNFNNNNLVKSYVLLFRTTFSSKENSNGMYNSNNNNNNSDLDEPLAKRMRNGRSNSDEEKVFGAELVLFDKHGRCLLVDGDYELVLQEVLIPKSSGKNSTWETMDEMDKNFDQFDIFKTSPTLRFSLRWSNVIVNGDIPLPLPALTKSNGNSYLGMMTCQRNTFSNNVKQVDGNLKRRNPKIFYQFLYNNNTRQQTEAREDLHCPWCSLDCAKLYSLLKHLKLCHSRFIFTYIVSPHGKGARVDVSINEFYDGSYAGNPHDLIAFPPGHAFSRNGPVRRTPVTTVIVCRPKRYEPTLNEFMDAEDSEFDGFRPNIIGHNRLYHHSGTCLPIRPQEIEIDSEAENDPEWLQIKTKRMIDEFTDVNEGEKELMKLWNLHVMKFGFVGDNQIPTACKMFVNIHGREILNRKLFRNFVLHMCNLLDFELIGASILYQMVRQLLMLPNNNNNDEDVVDDQPKAMKEIKEENRTNSNSTSSIKQRCVGISGRNGLHTAQAQAQPQVLQLNGQR